MHEWLKLAELRRLSYPEIDAPLLERHPVVQYFSKP
jgi:hypothetical protein